MPYDNPAPTHARLPDPLAPGGIAAVAATEPAAALHAVRQV